MLAARPAVRALAASKIRELFNAGAGRSDILAFWVGEPDEPTPEFIRRAGMDSIAASSLYTPDEPDKCGLPASLWSDNARPRRAGWLGMVRTVCTQVASILLSWD